MIRVGRRLGPRPDRAGNAKALAGALSEQSEIALAAPSPVLTFGHQDVHALSAARFQAAATTPNPYFMVPNKTYL